MKATEIEGSARSTTMSHQGRNLARTLKSGLHGGRKVPQEESARTAYTSNVECVNTLIARARAELADAQFDLDQTTVRAAGPGFVTQVSLRPGIYVLPTPFRPAMLFINTGNRDQRLVAAFQQYPLQRVKAVDPAEVAFDALPGRVFKAKVRSVIDAIAGGQLENSLTLVDPETRLAPGRALVQIDVSEDMGDYQIPLGSKAQVAIYTDHLHDLSLLRKILLRMKSWENYIFVEEL
jgi:multidrug resistance efflux pump